MTEDRTPPKDWRRFVPVAGMSLLAFAGLFGYEAGRMASGKDPALNVQNAAVTQPRDTRGDQQTPQWQSPGDAYGAGAAPGDGGGAAPYDDGGGSADPFQADPPQTRMS